MTSVHPVSQQLIFSLQKMIAPLARRSGDVDDIVQEVLIKVHKKGSSIEPSKFLSWLYQVCRTTSIDYYRKNKVHPPLSEHHLNELEMISKDESDPIPIALAKCIRPLMKNLKDEDQRVLSAIDLDGASQTEVAEKEGLKYSALKSKVQRARLKLKDEILECCQIVLDNRKRPLDVKPKKRDSCSDC